jgi:hypothetical protein
VIIRDFFAPDKTLIAHYIPGVGESGRFSPGYDPASEDAVHRQLADMSKHGIDAVMVDYYGPGKKRQETTVEMLFKFAPIYKIKVALMRDKGIYAGLESDVDRQRQLEHVDYWIVNKYLKESAYLRVNDKPLVAYFPNAAKVDWTVIKQMNPDINLIGQGKGAFLFGQHDGAFSWINPNGGLWDGVNIGEVHQRAFYEEAVKWPDKIAIAAAFPGFNDGNPKDLSKQVWDITKPARIMPRYRMGTFAYHAGAVPEFVKLVQLCTWNDFDERTDIEFGLSESHNR